MNMLISISWRNIWRHPGRSGVLIGAIVAGLWAGILVSSWANGLIEQRFINLIEEELTHLQIHHPEFLTEREPGMEITRTEEIFDFLESDERVRAYSARSLVDAMIQSPLTSSGVQVQGIMSDRERRTTTFHENLETGEYLDAELRNPVVIGRRLAEKLNVETGNRIVLTFQNLEQDLTSGSFTIAGIYHTGTPALDERNIYVRTEDLSTLLAERPVVHEIAVMLHDRELSDRVVADLSRHFETITAETWYELSPELRFMTDVGASYLFYIMVVIMLALAFGILNTMLMSIFERMREIGMLLAIGMNKGRIFTMIMLESTMLTLTGAAGGMALAYLSVSYLEIHGLDLSSVGGDTLAEWGYDALVYPFVHQEEYMTVTLMVILTALLAAIYPALKALKLNPADVVREK